MSHHQKFYPTDLNKRIENEDFVRSSKILPDSISDETRTKIHSRLNHVQLKKNSIFFRWDPCYTFLHWRRLNSSIVSCQLTYVFRKIYFTSHTTVFINLRDLISKKLYNNVFGNKCWFLLDIHLWCCLVSSGKMHFETLYALFVFCF